MRHSGAKSLHVQVAVARIRFTDGTEWTAKADPGHVFEAGCRFWRQPASNCATAEEAVLAQNSNLPDDNFCLYVCDNTGNLTACSNSGDGCLHKFKVQRSEQLPNAEMHLYVPAPMTDEEFRGTLSERIARPSRVVTGRFALPYALS